jgi:maltose alpha-D-glucosyltransferase/alpha-amylase
VLLAEANQMPSDVVEYFGAGDECHMAFHFPLMPRMYKALRDHDGATISQALADTPAIPEGCQWGIFLRNHDELTLEMVTEEERAFMYREYAPDPGMRRNVGIGRRLFPLVGDDRRQAELLHSLLLSLPGSPILYYGDEIGMGERMELGDRDPVRTPMQWDDTPNGGFSEAPSDWLYLPSIEHGEYGFPNRNVMAMTEMPDSFLCWLRDLVAIRGEAGVFGRGDYEHLPTDERSVFAYRRSLADDGAVVCVVNVSPEPVSVALHGLEPGGRVLCGAPGAEVSVAAGGHGGTVALPPFGWVWCEGVV